jgi:TolB-like protein
MTNARVLVLAALLAPLAAGAAPAKLRVAVMDIRPLGTEAAKAELISEVALTEAALFRGLEVIGKSDIGAIIGFEKQKQVMGCAEDSSCLAEIGGALGVDLVLVGSLGKLGSLYRIDLKLVETKKARVRGRIGTTVEGEEGKLVAAIQKSVRDLLGPIAPGGAPAKTAAAADGKADLAVVPPAPRQDPIDLGAAPAARPSRALGWTAFGAGVLSVGLGAFAAYEGMAARGKYDDAKGLLESGGTLKATTTTTEYRGLVSDGDSAKKLAYVSGGAAVGCAVLSGVLGYVSYKRTGDFGPFRF